MGVVRTISLLAAFVIGVLIVVALVRSGYADALIEKANKLVDRREDIEGVSSEDVTRGAAALQEGVADRLERDVKQELGGVLGVEDSTFMFDVVADIEPEYSTYERHLRAMNDDGARFVIVNGDLTSKGTAEQFREFDSFTDDRLDVPFHVTPGNHDILQDGDTSTFAAHFGYRYRSFDYNNSHFILLDNASAARGFDAEQLQWLKDDLRANTKPFVFLFMHRPLDAPFANVILGKDNELHEENVAAFYDIVRDANVDAIFAAHIPGYLEYTLEDVGIPVYASGGGGSPSSISFLEQDDHYLRVRVSDADVRVEKVTVPSP